MPRLLLLSVLAIVAIDLLLAALLALIPDPRQAQIVAGAEAPPRAAMEARAGAEWSDELEREARASKVMAYSPYTGHARRPYRGQWINVDAQGLRRVPAHGEAGDARAEVWVVGGSTVWGTGVPDTLTIPNLLAVELDRTGHALRVLNLGESGYVSTQSLIRIVERLKRGPPPRAVVWLDGANDVLSSLQTGAAGLPQNLGHRILEFNAAHKPEALVRVIAAHLPGVRALTRQLQPTPGDLAPLAAETAQHFKANLQLLDALAAHHGFVVLVGWQPVLFSKQTRSPGEQQAHDASNALHQRLALATLEVVESQIRTHPGYLPTARIFDRDPQPVYLDFCHLGEAGNRALAALFAQRLSERLASL